MIRLSALATSLALTSVALLGAGAAQATTLTFESTGDCSTSEVTITSPPGGIFGPCALGNAPGGSSALVQLGDGVSYWEAIFTTVVSNVSIDLGDLGQDEDKLFLWAWDVNNDLLNFTEVDIAANFSGMLTLNLAFSGIKSIVFGVYGSGVYADNLTFTPAPPEVPLPAALPLLATGLGALGFAGWRRKQKSATA